MLPRPIPLEQPEAGSSYYADGNHTSDTHWWNECHNSVPCQERTYISLAVAFGVVALVAGVQLVRIQRRVPEYGWTTQKVFHLLNFLCAGVRCGVLANRESLDQLDPPVARHILLDLPGLMFFTTYTLLVLFWAEIYHQARSLPTAALRPVFLATNAGVYAVEISAWIYMGVSGKEALATKISASFIAMVNLFAAVGFLLYGGRLFIMLRRFPIESKGRRKKLREVGCVTAICATCFTLRAALVAAAAVNRNFGSELDVVDHPLLNAGYYTFVEIIPSAMVLFILRKLPPKRNNSYQAIPSSGAENTA